MFRSFLQLLWICPVVLGNLLAQEIPKELTQAMQAIESGKLIQGFALLEPLAACPKLSLRPGSYRIETQNELGASLQSLDIVVEYFAGRSYSPGMPTESVLAGFNRTFKASVRIHSADTSQQSHAKDVSVNDE